MALRIKSQTKKMVPTIYRMLDSYFKKDMREQYTVEVQSDKYDMRNSVLYIRRNY